MTNYQRQIPIFTADLKSLLNKNWKTAIVIPRASEKREIEGILTDQQIPMSLDIEEGKVVLLDGVLTEGFELSDFNLALITAGDILGRQKLRKYSTSGSRKQIRYFSDLNPGDYVVQQVHGIGRYLGIRTIELSGVHRDYITIQYAGSDKLYLPVDQIGTLEKYIGPEGETPRLHTMAEPTGKKSAQRRKNPFRNWLKSFWTCTRSVNWQRVLPLRRIRQNRLNLKIHSLMSKQKIRRMLFPSSRRLWKSPHRWTCFFAGTLDLERRKWR